MLDGRLGETVVIKSLLESLMSGCYISRSPEKGWIGAEGGGGG